jgi:hypothetical protein
LKPHSAIELPTMEKHAAATRRIMAAGVLVETASDDEPTSLSEQT